jgi:hypothetical protein
VPEESGHTYRRGDRTGCCGPARSILADGSGGLGPRGGGRNGGESWPGDWLGRPDGRRWEADLTEGLGCSRLGPCVRRLRAHRRQAEQKRAFTAGDGFDRRG